MTYYSQMKENFRMEILTFDIETAAIPEEELSEIKRQELDKKFKSQDTEEERKAKDLFRGTSPWYARIVALAIHHERDGAVVHSECFKGEEREILANFFYYLNNSVQNHVTFISFNGKSFDVPFIIVRCALYPNITPNARFLNLRKFDNVPHYDIRTVISNGERYFMGNLRICCDHFGVASPKEGDITAENVGQAFYSGRIDEIAEYCLRDVISTAALFKEVVPYYPVTQAKMY